MTEEEFDQEVNRPLTTKEKVVWLGLLVFGCFAAKQYVDTRPATTAADPRFVQLAQESYNEVIECSGIIPELRYDDLHWIVAETLGDDSKSMFDPIHNQVVVAQANSMDKRVLKHELIHAFGVVGHPKEPFAKCNAE